MRTKYSIISILLIISTLVIIYFVKKLNNSTSNNSNSDTAAMKSAPELISYNLERNKLFEALPIDSGSIVFWGNSLTQNFELSEFFKGYNIKNRGINGDIIEGLIQRHQHIVNLKPKKLFIEIGTNDLYRKFPQNEIIKNYKRLIDTITSKLTETDIYIQSIFPINSNFKNSFILETSMNKSIIEINKEIKNYSLTKKLTFIDTYQQFEKNGELNSEFTMDGVHLNAKGYILWSKILKPYIKN